MEERMRNRSSCSPCSQPFFPTFGEIHLKRREPRGAEVLGNGSDFGYSISRLVNNDRRKDTRVCGTSETDSLFDP